MRKLTLVIALISILALALAPGVVVAQTTTSTGCLAVDGFTGTGTSFSFDAQEFLAGDVLIFAQPADVGESLAIVVSNAGVAVSSLVDLQGVFVYPIPADGEYTFTVEIPDGDATTPIELYCLASLDGEINDGYLDYASDGTICHIPPGNPDNAHTIVVGTSAIPAHLAHGDTLGACPDGVETSIPDYGAGVFIFFDDNSDSPFADLYGSCEDDNCTLIARIDITVLEPVVGFEYEFDENEDDDYTVIVYYLHPLTDGDNIDEGEGEDSGIYVFQINLFFNGEVEQDNTLMFIDEAGNLLAWATHDIWNNLDGFLAAFDIDIDAE